MATVIYEIRVQNTQMTPKNMDESKDYLIQVLKEAGFENFSVDCMIYDPLDSKKEIQNGQ